MQYCFKLDKTQQSHVCGECGIGKLADRYRAGLLGHHQDQHRVALPDWQMADQLAKILTAQRIYLIFLCVSHVPGFGHASCSHNLLLLPKHNRGLRLPERGWAGLRIHVHIENMRVPS